MLKARWAARENAPDTEVPATHARARHRVRQGRRRQELGHGEPGRGHRRVGLHGRRARRRHLGLLGAPHARRRATASRPTKSRDGEQPKIIPNERGRSGPALLKVVSTGMLVDDEGTALDVAGPHAHQGASSSSCATCTGAPLDYLLIDMPPGHRRRADGPGPPAAPHRPRSSSPRRRWARRRWRSGPPTWPGASFLRVAGVIENMSAFTCEHGDDVRAVRRRRRARPSPTRSAPSCSARCRSKPRWPPAATRGEPVALDGDGRGGRRVPGHRPQIVTETVPPVHDGRLLGAAARGRRGSRSGRSEH